MTFSEYLSYQAPPMFRDELIHGEIVLSPSANRKHADLCHALVGVLGACIKADYVVRLDTTHRLGEKEGPRPDVFVIGRARWIASDETGGYPEGIPELVVEVQSPSNDEAEMRVKRELYFSDPRCVEVWEVSQSPKIVTCYRRGESKVYTAGDLIPIPDRIRFGRLSVRRIYDGIV